MRSSEEGHPGAGLRRAGSSRRVDGRRRFLCPRKAPIAHVGAASAAPVPFVAAGSGDKQAKAKLCCIEIDEVAVAVCPPT